MSNKELCELTNMCMVYDGERILVQEKVKSDWRGLCFPGGHVEPGESFVDSVIREVKEETGLDISNVRLCGIKHCSDRKDGEYRYIVFFFKTDTFSGELRSSEEGKVFWIDKKDVGNYTLANGFDRMLEIFLDDSLTENYFWFEDGEWKNTNK